MDDTGNERMMQGMENEDEDEDQEDQDENFGIT